MRDRIEAVGRILLAAAHTDEHVEAPEVDRIEEILRRIWNEGGGAVEPLPAYLMARLSDFDPRRFDLDEAVRPFLHQPPAVKRRLLELVASVHDADGELDWREDVFVRKLGLTLGLALEQFQDLLLEVFPATPGTEAPAAVPEAAATRPARPPAKAKRSPAKPKAKAKARAKVKAEPKAKAKPKAKRSPAKAKARPASSKGLRPKRKARKR